LFLIATILKFVKDHVLIKAIGSMLMLEMIDEIGGRKDYRFRTIFAAHFPEIK
jgi:hypothetical protein